MEEVVAYFTVEKDGHQDEMTKLGLFVAFAAHTKIHKNRNNDIINSPNRRPPSDLMSE